MLTQNVQLHLLIKHKLVCMLTYKYNHLLNNASNLHCIRKTTNIIMALILVLVIIYGSIHVFISNSDSIQIMFIMHVIV